MFLPINVWGQAFSDTGSFSFTGSHNPVRVAQAYREFLPGDGVKIGPVQVHPFLGVAEVYTDNVFRTKTRRESDFLTKIGPGFQASLPFGGKHSMLLDYRAAQFLYSKFSGNNALAQTGVGHLILDYPGGLKIDFEGDHVEGFDARGSELDSQQQNITKWNSNTFKASAQMLGNNLGFSGRLRYTRVNYRNNGQSPRRDRGNTAATLNLLMPVTATTVALLGVNVSDQNFKTNDQLDSFAYGVFTGFRLAPSRQLTGRLNVGFTILNFDRGPVGSETTQGMDLESRELSLGGKQQKALFVRGNLSWRPTSRFFLSFRPFRSIQQAAVFNTSTFTRTGGGLRASQELSERVSISGSLFYSNDNFQGNRNDNRFRWRAFLSYRTVKWLGFRLAYIHSRRFSSQNRFDFRSNSISLSVQGFL